MGKTFTGGYTTRDVAKLLDVAPTRIRAFIRAGFLAPPRGAAGEYRFSLQDLVLLRTARDLAEHIPPRKLRRALLRLREQLPNGRPLTGVRITAEGDDVVARDGSSAWEPESGQGRLGFEVAELADKVAPLARRAAAAARTAEADLDAEDWFKVGFDLEPHEPDQARDAYRRALELDPTHADAHVNMGRLLHEAGHPAAAEVHYRLALAARPKDATAAFNLGVALEDMARPAEAIEAYDRAIASDPTTTDAHFNLARLYERTGRKAAAIRHLKAYRKLVAR